MKAINNRYKNYNECVEKIMDMENKKEIFVIRPPYTIDVKTVEKNPNRLQKAYDLGVTCAKEQLLQLKAKPTKVGNVVLKTFYMV